MIYEKTGENGMQRIFGGPPDGDGAVTVTGQDAYHLARVLRMREGDEVILSDPAGRDHLCRIEAAAPDAVRLRAVGSRENPGEPPYRAVLYQGMPKGDKPETVVQKAVELGAAEIVFVVTERAISRPDEKTAEKKRERYARVAEAAAKQCGRGAVPSPFFATRAAERSRSPLSFPPVRRRSQFRSLSVRRADSPMRRRRPPPRRTAASASSDPGSSARKRRARTRFPAFLLPGKGVRKAPPGPFPPEYCCFCRKKL